MLTRGVVLAQAMFVLTWTRLVLILTCPSLLRRLTKIVGVTGCRVPAIYRFMLAVFVMTAVLGRLLSMVVRLLMLVGRTVWLVLLCVILICVFRTAVSSVAMVVWLCLTWLFVRLFVVSIVRVVCMTGVQLA